MLQCYRWQSIPMKEWKIRPSVTLYPLNPLLPNLAWLITSGTPTHRASCKVSASLRSSEKFEMADHWNGGYKSVQQWQLTAVLTNQQVVKQALAIVSFSLITVDRRWWHSVLLSRLRFLHLILCCRLVQINNLSFYRHVCMHGWSFAAKNDKIAVAFNQIK